MKSEPVFRGHGGNVNRGCPAGTMHDNLCVIAVNDIEVKLKIATASWQVYIILCSDHSLYTGITTDIERRFEEHRCGRGAKYFLGRKPDKVVFLETHPDRSSAGRREAWIKKLPAPAKRHLIASAENPAVAESKGDHDGRMTDEKP